MISKVIQLKLNKDKVLFWSLLGVLVLFCGFYMYCVNATVHNVVTRQSLESEAGRLTLEIGRKEFEYISKRNSVTLALAHSMGYKDVSASSFISKSSGGQFSFISQ